MFVPATAGLAVEPLADPVAAVSMTPSTSVVDAA
jgi:hypothetical protein